MTHDAATPAKPRHALWTLAVVGGLVVLAVAGVLWWQQPWRTDCDDSAHQSDARSRLCYAVPSGWAKDVDASPAKAVGAWSHTPRNADDSRDAWAYTVVAQQDDHGDVRGYTSDYARIQASLGTADTPEFHDETSRALTVDGHDAATASLWFTDGPGGAARYVRVTVVEVDGDLSVLSGEGPRTAEVEAAIDALHDSLTVLT